MIDKLLIANRGEIAVRVIRAARMLEMETISIYSDQDANSLHVRLSDDAIALGGGTAKNNYLNIDKIINEALSNNVDGIHPGYGFLSESAEFAQAVIDAGITWVGPPPMAIEKLGDKITSREVAKKSGVPITPGTDEPVEPDKLSLKLAKDIGYPVMVKSAFGGGGMGMKVVYDSNELIDTIKMTQRQALAAFGKSEIFLEKYVENPKHIEIQLMADKNGNIIHLGERECSIQRRHQKLIEEGPSPALTDDEREDIGEKVKKLAKSVNYENAGTAEFLYKNGEFYFNEVNARLQVEHPVTEMITGKDLVIEQLKVASGKNLSWKQSEVIQKGHAIEFRINSEDPLHDFSPRWGSINSLNTPGGFGVRFDSHIYKGYKVPSDYDSLLGKLIVWGEDREQAIYRAYYAISELSINGIVNNLPFHRVVLANKEFHKGNTTTSFIHDNQILKYIKEAYNRRLAALISTGLKSSKVYLPKRGKSNWRDMSKYENVGRQN